MDNRIETLISCIGKLRDFSHTQDDLIKVKNALNMIFIPDGKCVNFIYTVNNDKLPFGCVILPIMNGTDINNFLIAGESIKFSEYEIEIDSKMFDYGLTDEEVTQVILYNIYHMIKNMTPCECVRGMIDDYLTSTGKILFIRNSIQYQAILAFGLYDALNQVVSCLYLPDEIENDAFLDDLGFEGFKDALNKLHRQIPYCDNEATRLPKLSMLEWTLRLYDNVETERIPALHILERAKELTASILYTNKINAAINALNRIDTELYVNEAVQQVFTEAKRKGGLIAYLRYSGLRDIESDLYEYQIRAKNAENEQDVMYALKQINARLAILDDFIREHPNDPEINRWIALRDQYLEIRDALGKKKLTKKQYGIFIDYDALDNLDNEDEE